MKVFTSTEFQRNPGDIFNAVQSDGQVDIKHKARPDMVLMLWVHKDSYETKIRGFKEAMLKLWDEKELLKKELDELKGL